MSLKLKSRLWSTAKIPEASKRQKNIANIRLNFFIEMRSIVWYQESYGQAFLNPTVLPLVESVFLSAKAESKATAKLPTQNAARVSEWTARNHLFRRAGYSRKVSAVRRRRSLPRYSRGWLLPRRMSMQPKRPAGNQPAGSTQRSVVLQCSSFHCPPFLNLQLDCKLDYSKATLDCQVEFFADTTLI